jgi:hypothetical protein
MVIKNFQQLATSSLKKQALLITEAGFAAMGVKTLIPENLAYNPKRQKLKIKNQEFELGKYKRIFCLSLTRGSQEALDQIKQILKDKIFLDIDLSQNGSIPEVFKDDLVICVIFDDHNQDGSPALSALRTSGANALEISMVSKRLQKLQGGQLAKIIYPATCLSLIFSGKNNNISLIAGAPTVKDTATNNQASVVLKKYNVLEQLNINSLTLRETPKEDKYFKNIHNILMLSPEVFLRAAQEKAEDLGFEASILSDGIKGFSSSISSIKKGQCLLSSGGSYQVQLKILSDLEQSQVVIFLSNGFGAIADQSSIIRAKALGLEIKDYLENNQAYDFFESLGQQIEIEPGINARDFIFCLS